MKALSQRGEEPRSEGLSRALAALPPFLLPFVLLPFVLLLCPAAPAAAAEGLGFTLGLIDFSRDLEAFEAGLEYRFRDWRYGLVPTVGVQVTEEEAFYAFSGLRRPFHLGSGSWEVAPSFSVGYYEQGDGQDLGHEIEFRSGIDLSRRLGGGAAVGLGFYHLSNASISSTNPGTNSLLLRIELPSSR